jgi:NAD+ diphosphatase
MLALSTTLSFRSLTMSYADAVNLPFNGEIISSHFTPLKPGEGDECRDGYWIFLQGDALILQEGGLYCGALPEGFPARDRSILFGTWDGEPLRLLTVPAEQPLPDGFAAVPLTELSDKLMTIYGLARQILYWEKMSSNCSRCGGEMERIAATWGKRCLGCGHEHYPHIHPCIIVLVKRGEEFLLAHKPEWPQGRYSLVAGFVDFGESLEECVVREVMEETGISVGNIRYVGSQNWPFPSQLMAGFVADYVSGEIAVDGDELEDARWFARDRMPAALPPHRSIARWIIERFALGNG